MKTYNIQKHDGNINKWEDTFTDMGQTTIDETHAETLNADFGSTGIKYVEKDTSKKDKSK